VREQEEKTTMKLMGLVFAFWLSVTVLAIGDTTRTNITTLSGIVYSNVVVTRVESDGLVLMTRKGPQKVQFTELSEDVRQQYSPKREKVSASEPEKQQPEASLSFVEKDAFGIDGKVIQVLNDGILLDGNIISPENRHKEQEWRKQNDELQKQCDQLEEQELKLKKKGELYSDKYRAVADRRVAVLYKQKDVAEKASALFDSGMYFVVGVKESLVDSDQWHGDVYCAGVYQYTAVTGAGKTVRRYATSKELADKLLAGTDSRKE
jgi:hypothetical protein